MKSTGGGLRKMGGNKMREFLKLNKKQNGEMHISFPSVGTTQLIQPMEMECQQQNNEFCGLVLWCTALLFQGVWRRKLF